MSGILCLMAGALGPPPSPPVTYATWDPSFSGSGRRYTNGNLTFQGDTESAPSQTTIGNSTGKWVVGLFPLDNNENVLGAAISTWAANEFPGQGAGGHVAQFGFYGNLPRVYQGVNVAFWTPVVQFFAGDEVDLFIDLDNGIYRFYINGTAVGVDKPLPDWVAGQVWVIAAGRGGDDPRVTLNAGVSPTTYMTTIATARSANAGWWN